MMNTTEQMKTYRRNDRLGGHQVNVDIVLAAER